MRLPFHTHLINTFQSCIPTTSFRSTKICLTALAAGGTVPLQPTVDFCQFTTGAATERGMPARPTLLNLQLIPVAAPYPTHSQPVRHSELHKNVLILLASRYIFLCLSLSLQALFAYPALCLSISHILVCPHSENLTYDHCVF